MNYLHVINSANVLYTKYLQHSQQQSIVEKHVSVNVHVHILTLTVKTFILTRVVEHIQYYIDLKNQLFIFVNIIEL